MPCQLFNHSQQRHPPTDTPPSDNIRAFREERMRVLESVARRFRLDDVEARFFL